MCVKKFAGATLVAVVLFALYCGGGGGGGNPAGGDDTPITPTQYTLQTSANPAVGGTVSPAGRTEQDSGTSVSITAVANEGYEFANWFGDGVEDEDSPTTTVLMSENRTIIANFRPIEDDNGDDEEPRTTYILETSALPSAGGTVTPSGSATRDSGTTVTVTAIEAQGYTFTGWMGAPESVNASEKIITFNLNSNVTLIANFELAASTHTLNVSANPAAGGSVSRVPNQTNYDSGTSITVVASHAEGYVFTGWTGAPSSVNAQSSSITFEIGSNMTLVANFEPVTVTHELTTNANPMAGGSVTPGGTVTRETGTSVTVTAVEAEGYEFTNWTGAPSSVDASSKSITFNIDDDMTLIANFRQIVIEGPPPTFTLATDVTPTTGGNVTRSPNQAAFESETEITLTATPGAGYEFLNWSGSLSSSEQTLSFKILSDMNMTANFKRVYTLTANAAPTAGGVVVREPAKTTYDVGEIVTVTAAPADGYEFVNWSGESTSANPQVNITMDANKTLTANFRRVYTLTVDRNSALGGTVTRSPEQATYADGATVTVTAAAHPGFRFTHWSGASSATTQSVTITMDGNKTLTANFEALTYELETNAEPTAGGSVTRNPSQDSYNHGTTVTVSATASSGYRFAGWSGASESASSTITVEMNDDVELVANFELIPTYTLTVNRNINAGGNVSVNNGANNPNPASFAHGTSVTVSATANSGYRFVSWAGASESTSLTITIEMNDDVELTANFELIPTYTVTVSSVGAGATGGGHYAEGETVTIFAGIPPTNYTFGSWTSLDIFSGFADVNNPTTTFTMPRRAVTVTALFTVIPNSVVRGTMTDLRDGITYNTVTIGSQTWMAENLNYTPSGSSGFWCYRNNTSECNTYGRLYDWATAMALPDSCNTNNCFNLIQSNHQGICPAGWHLPSITEWTTLIDAIGGQSTSGRHLKAKSGWHGCGPSGSNNSWLCEDTYGFSALPGGNRYGNDFSSFTEAGFQGAWWSASPANATTAHRRGMINTGEGSFQNASNKAANGFSVRCIKDD